MRVGYEIHYYIKYSCEGNTNYKDTDYPETEEEFDETISFRKSEGWESIGHISNDMLRVEILYMEVSE